MSRCLPPRDARIAAAEQVTGTPIGALTGEAGGLQGSDEGKIEVQDRLSYVAVAPGVVHAAVRCLNAGRIKGKRFRATLVGPRGIARR